jgi:hypothetical protein
MNFKQIMKENIKKIIQRFFKVGNWEKLDQLSVKIDILASRIEALGTKKDFALTDVLSPRIDQGTQILLSLKYQELLASRKPLPHFEEVECRVFSQNGEDGILLYIFSLIGTTNKKCIEICASNGLQCNTANLIINHGWIGLLFDGQKEFIEQGQQYYSSCLDTLIFPPRFVHAWVTAENVNSLIAENGVRGEIDLLSLDMDGIDYWVLKAIDVISPRVIVLEYNNLWGPEKAVTVPYRPDFKAGFEGIYGVYSGASLMAFVKLLKVKGYRLVGCERYGYNAFFVKNGIGEDILPEVGTASCVQHPFTHFAREVLLPKALDKEWIEV